MVEIVTGFRCGESLQKSGASQSLFFNIANISSAAIDAKGIIRIFNIGAGHMLDHAKANAMNKIKPADISTLWLAFRSKGHDREDK